MKHPLIPHLILTFGLAFSANAKEMKCGEDSFPGYPADSNVKGHIYCLKACGSQGGYIYLVQDTDRHFGKNNDRARFKIVRSKFVATNKGPYGNQRVMEADPAAQCLIANRLTEAVPLVSVIADFNASNRDKEKAMKKIAKIGVKPAEEANVVLEQIRSTLTGVECAEENGINFRDAKDQFTGGLVENKEIAVATQNELTTLAFASSKANGKKQEIFQCQAKNNPKIVSQLANNLLQYRTNTSDSPRNISSPEGAR